MGVFWQIGFQSVEILTLVFGILGITFSLLLLFSPTLIQSVSHVFNRYINVDQKIAVIDKSIQIDSFVYSHHVLFGLCLMAGSIFSLIFFFFRLDISTFANVFFVSEKYISTNKMVFYVVSWIGKVACILGLIVGTLLTFRPAGMKKIEHRLNAWFETRPMVEKLDRPTHNLDTFLFQHPVAFGIAGLILSFFIVVLSILNFLG